MSVIPVVGGKLRRVRMLKKAQESARRTPEPSRNGPCHAPASAEAPRLQPCHVHDDYNASRAGKMRRCAGAMMWLRWRCGYVLLSDVSRVLDSRARNRRESIEQKNPQSRCASPLSAQLDRPCSPARHTFAGVGQSRRVRGSLACVHPIYSVGNSLSTQYWTRSPAILHTIVDISSRGVN